MHLLIFDHKIYATALLLLFLLFLQVVVSISAGILSNWT